MTAPVRRTLRLCRHEAAHAVTMELMGGRVAEVRILDTTVNKDGFDAVDAYTRRDRRTALSPLAVACICAAGNAIEHLYRDMAPGSYSPGDALALQEGGMCGFDIRLLDCLMQRWLTQGDVRRAVDAVARELMKRNLTGADVRRIIKESKKGKKHAS